MLVVSKWSQQKEFDVVLDLKCSSADNAKLSRERSVTSPCIFACLTMKQLRLVETGIPDSREKTARCQMRHGAEVRTAGKANTAVGTALRLSLKSQGVFKP